MSHVFSRAMVLTVAIFLTAVSAGLLLVGDADSPIAVLSHGELASVSGGGPCYYDRTVECSGQESDCTETLCTQIQPGYYGCTVPGLILNVQKQDDYRDVYENAANGSLGYLYDGIYCYWKDQCDGHCTSNDGGLNYYCDEHGNVGDGGGVSERWQDGRVCPE